MHTPDAQPRPSIFYNYTIHPAFVPVDGCEQAPGKVVIVGAGPAGMLTALELARFGVPSIVLEQELQVSHGSRALALTRRTLEILQHAGVAGRFVEKGLPWSQGRSFYRGTEVYRMEMPHDGDDRFLPVINLQQQYIEEFLVDAIEASPLIDLRWGCKVIALAQREDAVVLEVDTPSGRYDLTAPWVVAADGGRSVVRKMLNLRMEGTAYAGNFVIADIRTDLPLPTGRLCYFDPDWSPGNNALVHRAPDGIWRLDFRLPENESPEQALAPARLGDRIDRILKMVGYDLPWELDWATVYSASALTLTDFMSGRVLFTGDAAHLLPIFGVRGINTGAQDCENLAWKLAFVVKGLSDPALLTTYSAERVEAALEICEEAGKSTRFMTPPTRGFRLMRDAVLSLSLSQQFPKDLLHWRTSRPHVYHSSPLNSFPDQDGAFAGGPRCGESIRNVKLGGDDDYLFDRFRTGFHLMAFAGAGGLSDASRAVLHSTRGCPVPAVSVVVCARRTPELEAAADIVIDDPDGRVARKYAAADGSAYLFRPDLHVCARWRQPTAADVTTAIAIAAGRHSGQHQ